MTQLTTSRLWGMFVGLIVMLAVRTADGYEHFRVAVYARAQEVREMADPAWLQARWPRIADHVHVDKIYLIFRYLENIKPGGNLGQPAAAGRRRGLRDGSTVFSLEVPPHSFRVFRMR